MKKNIILVIVIIIIAALIVYLQSTIPKTSNEKVDADLKIESIADDNSNNNNNGNQQSATTTSEESYNEPVLQLTEEDKLRIAQKSSQYPRAKELVGPDGFINIDELTLSEHLGKKVILIDFWTYSCINCQRTFPYITKWYDEYKDKGLLIVGVHTPEFEFEKDRDNVVKAAEKWDINYPIVQDNDRQIWRAYNNHYWPAKYMIDIDGFIVYTHFGEGSYAETEKKIQELLEERNQVLGMQEDIKKDISEVQAETPDFSGINTPEIYFGYAFSRNQMGNSEGWHPGDIIDYQLPESETFSINKFYLAGSWLNNQDNMELVSDSGKIILEYNSKIVNLVAGSASPQKVKVYIDGQETDEIEIFDFDLYQLYDGNEYGQHRIELSLPKGVMVYTFTFG